MRDALSRTAPARAVLNDRHGRIVTRAFLGGSAGHVVGIGKIELRNRSYPVRSIAPGADVHLTIGPDKIASVPAAY